MKVLDIGKKIKSKRFYKWTPRGIVPYVQKISYSAFIFL